LSSDSNFPPPAASIPEVVASPRWIDPTLIPEFAETPQWGIFNNGLQPMTLPDIIALIESGRGTEQWNGKGERPDVVYVARPDNSRPVPAVECPELRPAILKRDEAQLATERNKSGVIFYPLLLFTLLCEIYMRNIVLLPAIFAMSTGVSHIEAWRALKHLRSNPDGYLQDTAAKLRYAAWLSLAGSKFSRTLALVAIWVVVYAVQYFMPSGAGKNAEPAYIAAAALVKSAVFSEPWRLFTATMLHGSIIHLLFNASTMLALGLLIERGAHRHLLAPVWLAGALAGSLLSWAATPTTSVGASGGILAVFSFLLIMGRRCRSQLPPDFGSSLTRSLLTIVMLGLLAWGVIDNAAHLGGAIAGAAIAHWIFRDGHSTLPLADTRPLLLVGRAAEITVAVIALVTLAKLLFR
jgi:membrane associated rhomboid family serine protease